MASSGCKPVHVPATLDYVLDGGTVQRGAKVHELVDDRAYVIALAPRSRRASSLRRRRPQVDRGAARPLGRAGLVRGRGTRCIERCFRLRTSPSRATVTHPDAQDLGRLFVEMIRQQGGLAQSPWRLPATDNIITVDGVVRKTKSVSFTLCRRCPAAEAVHGNEGDDLIGHHASGCQGEHNVPRPNLDVGKSASKHLADTQWRNTVAPKQHSSVVLIDFRRPLAPIP